MYWHHTIFTIIIYRDRYFAYLSMTEKSKKELGTIFEEKVKDFLKFMRFEDVCGGDSFKPGGRQVDAVAGWEDTLFIIECKTKEELGSSNILGTIDALRGKSITITDSLRTMNDYYCDGKTYNFSKYKKFIFVIATENIIVSKTEQQHANQGEPSIYLWYEIFFD